VRRCNFDGDTPFTGRGGSGQHRRAFSRGIRAYSLSGAGGTVTTSSVCLAGARSLSYSER